MGWGHLKTFFSRITDLEELIFTWEFVDSSLLKSWSLGVEGDHNRENHIYMCLYWKKKIFRTSRPISIKLGTNDPWVKGIQNCTNKGSSPFQRGDNHKNTKIGWGHLKICSRIEEPEEHIFTWKLTDINCRFKFV
jgi:hypothetical protein